MQKKQRNRSKLIRRMMFGIVILGGGLIGATYSCSPSEKAELSFNERNDTLELIDKPELLYGFDLSKYKPIFDTVRNGMNWNDLFSYFNISQQAINLTAENAKDSLIDIKYIRSGKPFITFFNKETEKPEHLVYEVDPFSYVTFKCINEDSIALEKGEKPTSIYQRVIAGEIEPNSNLSNEIAKNFNSYSMTAEIASSIEGVFAWSVDFFRLQAEDKFVSVYNEKVVDNQPFGVESIKYMWFEHEGEGLYAFYYEDEENDISGYYDEEGNALKRPFLMAPVEYTRISSFYNKGRFHPVLKQRRAHLGTDYAAPTGTPIHATADGTVEIASYTGGNGNYVKIRHNKTYQTQYLHMSKIGAGMKRGVRVKQGDVIGYVGQTGLATGPHVCYRFWKNGVQIDPRSEKFPKSEPMQKEAIPAYLEYIKPLKIELDKEIEKLQDNHKLQPTV